jgi:hypothetical protein
MIAWSGGLGNEHSHEAAGELLEHEHEGGTQAHGHIAPGAPDLEAEAG